jgi:hypothetical protein
VAAVGRSFLSLVVVMSRNENASFRRKEQVESSSTMIVLSQLDFGQTWDDQFALDIAMHGRC